MNPGTVKLTRKQKRYMRKLKKYHERKQRRVFAAMRRLRGEL